MNSTIAQQQQDTPQRRSAMSSLMAVPAALCFPRDTIFPLAVLGQPESDRKVA